MSDNFEISCTISGTDITAQLGLEIWINDQQIFDNYSVASPQLFSYKITESDGNHELRFVMKNKRPDHTVLDHAGNIIKDAKILINNLTFDEIELGQVLFDHAEYTHNFNGTGATTTEKFYGEIGCNGTVSLKFTTPIYLWLLENM